MEHVAIIGGGAAAAVTVGELLRQQGGEALSILWICGPSARGRGVAYATEEDYHILNVRAAGMGIFSDDAGAFFRHAAARSSNAKASDFLPRSWFGDFLEVTVAELIEKARQRGHGIEIIERVAVAVRANESGAYAIELDDGSKRASDRVVLAPGALPACALAEVSAQALDSGNYCIDPWRSCPRALPPSRVLVIGTGLSAVDAILHCAAQWPESHITAVSRHGRLPSAHLRVPAQPYEYQDELIDAMLATPSARRWSHLLHEAAADDGVEWRALVDGLRPSTTKLWLALSPAERKRFLRHLRAIWEPLRHRLPPQSAAVIQQLRDSGRLEVFAAHVAHVDGDLPLHVRLRERGGDTQVELDVDLVIQATGLRLDATTTVDPLIAQLVADHLAHPDTVGLGLHADSIGRLCDENGKTTTGLYLIGALLRGSVWECAAYAEIRTLARQIAQDLISGASGTARKSRATPISGLSRNLSALST